MKENDMYEAIIDIGKKRGRVTCEEINEALPPEFFSLDELERFMDRLKDIGVRVMSGAVGNN